MEEYEVNLKDYINVIKKEKLLILAVFLAAVISAGVFSFSQPDEYEATATLYIKNLPLGEDFQQQYNSLDVTMSFLSSEYMLRQTASAAELHKIEPFVNSANPTEAAVGWLKGSIKIEDSGGSMITLQIKGTLEPGVLKSILDTHIDVFIRESNSRLAEDVQAELLTIKEKRELLESQKTETVKSLSEINLDNPSERAVMMERFIGLTSQLTSTENQLNNLDLYEKNLEIVISPDYEWIKILSPPYEPNVPVGPQRLLNIIIAGVLGLFVGVFVAFFRNYMEESS